MAADSEWWVFALIPLISGIVGWGTNWLALKMTFYPLEFWPVKVWQPHDEPFGLFGWQGIIPAKAATMAGDFCEVLTTKLFSVEEIFRRIDPEKMADILEPGLEPSIRRIVSQLGEEYSPTVWASLPAEVHAEIFDAVKERTRPFIVDMIHEMSTQILKVFDIKHMTIDIAVNNKQFLVDMFQTVGDEEFVFIERSGFYFGFLFGLVQAVIFYFYDAWWILPLAGFFVGCLCHTPSCPVMPYQAPSSTDASMALLAAASLPALGPIAALHYLLSRRYATNWLALFVIFNPLEPHHTPCCTIQGVFLKRQGVVAEKFAKMSEELFLQPANMWHEIFEGARKEAFDEMLQTHAKNYCDETLGAGKIVVGLIFGEKYYEAKQRFAELMRAELPNCTHLTSDYMRECLDLTDEIEGKMRVLPANDFERILHAVFEADELKLILVGAVLGAGAGFAQTFAFNL